MNAKRGYGGNESGEMKDEESEMFYDKTYTITIDIYFLKQKRINL